MRNENRGIALPLIPFKLIDEEPIVLEASWDDWDYEVAKLEANTAEGRAMRLAEID